MDEPSKSITIGTHHRLTFARTRLPERLYLQIHPVDTAPKKLANSSSGGKPFGVIG